jgi:hypothetical protein
MRVQLRAQADSSGRPVLTSLQRRHSGTREQVGAIARLVPTQEGARADLLCKNHSQGRRQCYSALLPAARTGEDVWVAVSLCERGVAGVMARFVRASRQYGRD